MRESILFSPVKLNSLEIKNRFVRSATNEYMADPEGHVTERLVHIYRGLAEGGAGLIITGFMYVHPSGKSSPGQTGIYSDELIPGLKEITDTVHEAGDGGGEARVVAQIVHGGRQVRAKYAHGDIIAPSAITDKKTGITPREMIEEEIESAIGWFTDAIIRAKESGFDGVQLHCAHGYLLSQFHSPYTNRRADRWGGSLENRTRITVELVRKARDRVGEDFPILIKMNASDFIDGGIDLPESIEVARILSRNGIDAIEISGGMAESEGNPSVRKDISREEEEAYFRKYAEQIKPAVDIPVILVGGMRSFKVMEEIVQEGIADLLSMSRPFIREPDLVQKFMDGKKDRADCISCSKCFNLRGIRCAQIAGKS